MSNLCVKMMSGENLPDEDSTKGFTLVEAFGEVICGRTDDGKPRITIPREETEHPQVYFPEGNTYLLKNGKTVATFAYTSHKAALTKLVKTEGRKCEKYLAHGSCIFMEAHFDNIEPTKYIIILPELERIDGMLFIEGNQYIYVDSFHHPEANVVMSVYEHVYPPKIIEVNRQAILDLYASELDYLKRPKCIVIDPALEVIATSHYFNVSGDNRWYSIPDLDTINKVGLKLTHHNFELDQVVNIPHGSLVVHIIDIPNITEKDYDKFTNRIYSRMVESGFIRVTEVYLNPSDKYTTDVFLKK